MEITVVKAPWRPNKPWMVHYRPDGAKGKQRRLFFALKVDADELAVKLRATHHERGTMALTLTVTEMQEYRAAKQLADGADLLAIVKEWRARLARPNSPRLIVALEEFLTEQRARNSAGYAVALKSQVGGMVARLPQLETLRFDRVTAEQITAALRAENEATALETLADRRRMFATFMRWGIRRGWREDDPMQRVPTFHVPRPTPKFYSVPEVKILLERTAERAPWLLPAVALRLFAGVRSGEVKKMAKLYARDVQVAENRVLVRGEVAKGRASRPRPRLIEELPPSVWRWLELGELVWPTWGDEMLRTAIADGVPELRNGLRHTFATYATAYFESYEKVARIMGNSAEVVKTHYAGLATRAQAKEFFALDPAGWAE